MKMMENLLSLQRINKTYTIKYGTYVEEISFKLEDIESLKMEMEYSK